MSIELRGSLPERLQVATTWPASEPKLAEWCDGVGCVVYWSPEDHSGEVRREARNNRRFGSPVELDDSSVITKVATPKVSKIGSR
jgi:hypothetical protein